jgi:hypothetical protein
MTRLAVAGFALTKWYLDVVAPDGVAVIGYAAELSWGDVRLHYASTLLARPQGASHPSTRATLHTAQPVDDGARITWRSNPLAVDGEWRPLAAPTGATLYASPDGAVRWDCRYPRARARVEVDGAVVEGLGYVERLELTLPPWKMPIRELRWGRALTETEGVVWVDWRGDGERLHDVQWVDRAGARLGPCVVDDHGVVADGAPVVRFVDATPLRTGQLGANVLHALPAAIVRRLPPFVVAMDERKTLSRARVGDRQAWCIHEVVRFP